MIERFNFYDVYGYLLPGATLLGLIWLPFGIVQHLWPANAFSSAVAAIAFSYIIGHILQTLGSNAFPSKAKDTQGQLRYPSDFLLDPDDSTLAPETKQQIGKRVKAVFALELDTDKYGGNSEISRRRADAFFLCRTALIKAKIAAYPEQFEGMYALMRGLALAFWLGASHLTGWVASSWKSPCFHRVAPAAGLISLGAAVCTSLFVVFVPRAYGWRQWVDRLTFTTLIVGFLGLGVGFASGPATSSFHVGPIGAIALAAVISGLKCFGAYKFFAQEFAKAVWRDFYLYEGSPSQDGND